MFAYVHGFLADETWGRITGVVTLVSNLGMINFKGGHERVRLNMYLSGSIFLYVALSINSNVTSVNATKYAVEGDFFFDQKSITTMQLITQNMLGKIAGPLMGACKDVYSKTTHPQKNKNKANNRAA